MVVTIMATSMDLQLLEQAVLHQLVGHVLAV
jgi:hypothetical protein